MCLESRYLKGRMGARIPILLCYVASIIKHRTLADLVGHPSCGGRIKVNGVVPYSCHTPFSVSGTTGQFFSFPMPDSPKSDYAI
jgi:hypothetical protein